MAEWIGHGMTTAQNFMTDIAESRIKAIVRVSTFKELILSKDFVLSCHSSQGLEECLRRF